MRSLLSLCAVGALLTACEDDGGLTDTRAQLESDATSLAFGPVPIGATKRLRLVLRNEGGRELRIEDVQVSSPFFVGALPEALPPGGVLDVDVGYRPLRVEADTGQLNLMSSGGSLSLPLSGEGVASTVRVRPGSVDFGQLEAGDTASIELFFEQLGPEEVGGPMVAEGFSRPEHFRLPALGSSFLDLEELVLPPRGALQAELIYAPRIESLDAGVLRFETCGSRCGLEIEIRGEAGAGILAAEPTAVDFGGLGVGTFETRQVIVRNQGDRPVELRSADRVGDAAFSFEVEPSLPATLVPGDIASLRVRFAPEQPGRAEAQIELGLPEDVLGPLVVPMAGEGLGPNFVVLPPDVGFGVLRQMEPVEQRVVLSNSGSASLEVTGAALSGDPAFSLRAPALPVTLQSGQSAFAFLRFEPQVEGVFTATVTFTSTDPGRPEVEVDVRAAVGDAFCEIDVRPAIANFGVTPPGRERSRTVLLRNLGDEACELRGLSGGPSFAPDFRILQAPGGALAPGAEAEVEIVFSPSEEVDAKSTLFVETDDPIAPRVAVGLVGTGAGYAELIAIPPVIDFGPVDIDCGPASAATRLVNIGSNEIRIEDVVFELEAPEITLQGDRSASLAGGASGSWGARLAPSVLGPVEAEIRFEFERLPFPFFVPVRGEVVEAAVREERFEQRDRSRTDVLFVIDDSCSMQDDQQALATNIQDFIEQADLQNVSYRVGITTTSVTILNGDLVGPVIDSDLMSRSDAIRAFRQQAQVGIGGSGFEQGLQSAVSAFEAAARDRGFNRELLARDAGVVLVIVSDEDDNSTEPVEFFYDALRQLVPDLVVAIVSGGELGCLPSTFPAPRYVDFVQLTGGIGLDICQDWGPNLRSLGNFAFGLSTRFELEGTVDEDFPVEVEVDGAPVSNWRLDGRTIIFDGAPAPSAEILVRYTQSCQ